jgi:PD-(D/E)XK nuclease superfamily
MIQDPKNLYFSPSGMDTFTTCREAYRLKYIEQVETSEPQIHLTFGRACHKIPECYWKGLPQEKAFDEALKVCGELGPPMLLPSKIRDKWLVLMDGLMESVEAYYTFHDANDSYGCGSAYVHMLEQEFQYQMIMGPNHIAYEAHTAVFITGRIDQYIGTTLRELKTASEIGANWKHDYRNYLLRNWGLQVYDWYLCHRTDEAGHLQNWPAHIEVEVLVKPYRDKRPKMELFDLTKEIVSYRERTAQQVEWICREMSSYHLQYAQVQPWPMSSTACTNKFGVCDYLVGCCQGHEKAAEKGLYKIRERVAK